MTTGILLLVKTLQTLIYPESFLCADCGACGSFVNVKVVFFGMILTNFFLHFITDGFLD
jgi:NAD-dependent SIR2 family protein deacetylase